MTLETRFWAKVQKTDTCWVWTAATFPSGHGKIYLSKEKGLGSAHIVSFKLAHGDTNNCHVLHRCKEKLCVRPDHLFLGNHARDIRFKEIDIEDQYEAKIDRSAGDEKCHPWTEGKNSFGYGVFVRDGETLAARWAYKRFVGPLTSKEVVRHTCDNRACQNRTHWIKGTQAQNVQDAVERNRQYRPSGVKNVKAKLTEEQVRSIRSDSTSSHAQLARFYAVSYPTIAYIRSGKTWRHLL